MIKQTTTHRLAAIFLSILVITVACNSGKTGGNAADTTKKAETPKVDTTFIDNIYNETARYLSGLPQMENNQFSVLENNKRWQKYATEADTSWSKLYSERLIKMQEFGKSELASANKIQTLFYPFSGPDILNVYQFFPNAQQYIMIGLEPLGGYPEFDNLKNDSSLKYISEIKEALHNVVATSFFKTLEMRVQLHSNDLNGTLPIISLFITRIGGRIVDYTKVYVDKDGKLNIAGNEPKDSMNIYGSKITFRTKNSTELQTVIYFSADISDGGFKLSYKGRPNFKIYLQTIQSPTTYIKSASYLMFKDKFSAIRGIILNQSAVLLQDDSGIPLKFLSDSTWNKTFYGIYNKPIDLFASDYQKDLKEAYTNGKYTVKPLNFGIGYNYSLKDTHLMLFQRKK
jgi:hypothetical protein